MSIFSGNTKRQDRLPVGVFVFGDTMAGKSTLLASLVNYFADSSNCLLVHDSVNKAGSRVLITWLKRLAKCNFPPATPQGNPVEIDIGLDAESIDLSIKLKIYEMSGEDLTKFDVTGPTEGEVDREFLDALQRSNLILAVCPVDKMEDNKILLAQFFNFLYGIKKQCPVAIVITKWDLIEGEISFSVPHEKILEDLVEGALAHPIKFLRRSNLFSNPRVFRFSVGDVENGNILNRKFVGIEEIANWIVENQFVK